MSVESEPALRGPFALFAAFFLLGVVQAAPSVTTGDAGEFAAAAATLGVAHAPGYPLFVLLAKAFGTLFALGSWAYRTNLLSAACASAALALFSDALRRFGAGRAARLGAAAVLGLSPLWREQSAVTEVFALQLLCAALLLWIVAAAGDRLLEAGPAAALGLAFGLGLGDHQTLALILPALILAARGRPGPLPRGLAFATLGTAAGFAVNIVLPLRAAQAPPLDWDHATTLKAFWRLLSRKDYGSMALTVEGGQAAGAEALAAQAWRSLRGIAGQLGPLGAALALLGAAGWRRSGLRLQAPAAWAWILGAGPAFLMLGRPPFDVQTSSALERFHLLPLLGAGLFVAAGLEILARARPLAGAAAALAAAAVLVPAAAAQSRRADFLAHDYGRTILRELPPGATFVMDGGDDTFYSLAFLQFAQGLREDASLYDRGGVVFHSPYGADFLSLPRDSKEERRRAIEGPWASDGRLWYSTLNPGLLPGWDARPAGLLRRPLRPGALFPEGAALRETLALPRAPSAAARYRDRALLAFVYFQRGVEALSRRDAGAGASWLQIAAGTGGDALWAAPAISYALAVSGYEATARRDWPAAERVYRAQLELDAARAEPAMNLGVVLQSETPASGGGGFHAGGRAPRAAPASDVGNARRPALGARPLGRVRRDVRERRGPACGELRRRGLVPPGGRARGSEAVTLLVFASAFLAYLRALPPALAPWRDTGEMSLASWTLGVAHPTSYPLYVLIGRLARLVPLGNFAYRLNVLSAVAGASAAALLFAFVRRRRGLFPALAAAAWLAFNAAFWTVSQVSEMYSLWILCAIALMALALTASEEKDERLWPAFCFLAGLLAGNRLDIVLWAPGLLWVALAGRPAAKGEDGLWAGVALVVFPAIAVLTGSNLPFAALIVITALWLTRGPGMARRLAVASAAFAGGLSIYLFLPARSATGPFLDWNHPAVLSNFLDSILRTRYGGTLDLISTNYATGALFGDNLRQWGAHLWDAFGPAGLAAALVGCAAGFRDDRRRWLGRAACWWWSGPVFIFLANMPPNPHASAILEPHYLISDAALVFWAADGVAALAGSSRALGPAFAAAALLWPLWRGVPARADRRAHLYNYDFARNVFASAPPGAVVVAKKDVQLYALWHYQTVQGWRPDLRIVAQGLAGSPWYRASWRRRDPEMAVSSLAVPEGWSALAASGRPVLATQDAELPGARRRVRAPARAAARRLSGRAGRRRRPVGPDRAPRPDALRRDAGFLHRGLDRRVGGRFLSPRPRTAEERP